MAGADGWNGRIEAPTRDQGKFEIAFPVGTHDQLLWVRGCLQGRRCVGQCSRAVRAIAASTHTFLVIAARRGAVRPKGEEPGTTPGRAGDGAGDCGEAGIGRALPLKPFGCDGDGVALAVIVANEHRAGLELTAGRAAVTRQSVQEPRLSRSSPPKACSCRR
jgi:hypothetical protein